MKSFSKSIISKNQELNFIVFFIKSILKRMCDFNAQLHLFYKLDINTNIPKLTQLLDIYIYIT